MRRLRWCNDNWNEMNFCTKVKRHITSLTQNKSAAKDVAMHQSVHHVQNYRMVLTGSLVAHAVEQHALARACVDLSAQSSKIGEVEEGQATPRLAS
eukprot:m.135751 g.135751  ORF g.135751 m.135751 type:complete len:96 (+) comp13982_c0_seq14:148-435(+)